MQRVLALLALVVCAFLVTGCGGSALQAKARKVVGDPHATVVNTETVDPLGGGRLAVVVMKPGGSQGLGCLDIREGPGRCPLWSDAYVRLGATTHADMGDLGISRWQVAAIARARATNSRFGIFPIVNQLTVRCAIPNPNLSVTPDTLAGGMCATIALPFGRPVQCVGFIEAWRPSAAGKLHTRGWIVRFSRDGHVQSTQLKAHPIPPWNGHQPNTCSEVYAANADVVLGKHHLLRYGFGWGTQHPRSIFNGGDPGGKAWRLTWRNWGAASAYARGRAWIPRPGGNYYGKPGVIELRASHIGRCTRHGPGAYTFLQAREAVRPGGPLSRWFAWGGWASICKGPK
jgi:hypothetical protein